MKTRLSPAPRVAASPEARDTLRRADITVTRAARLLGVTQSYVSHWLAGRRDLDRDRVVLLANAIGVPIEDLACDAACPRCGTPVAA